MRKGDPVPCCRRLLIGWLFGPPQLCLDRLDGRKCALELFRELFEMRELRDAKRLSDIAEGVLRHNSALRFAQDEANTRLVVGMAKHVIDGGEVEVHLAGILRLKCAHPQVDNDEASELQVVEEQVKPEILSSNIKRHLAPDEGETHAEFDEELAQVREKSLFEIALVGFLSEGEKVEVVWIFEDLLCEIGLWSRQCRLEIGNRLSLAPIEPAFNLEDENISTPSVVDGLAGIPEPFLAALHFLQDGEIVIPGQLCKRFLHNCLVRPCLR